MTDVRAEAGTASLPTVADTIALGERIGRGLRAGDVVVLSGPLGAGKTALAKGIARGMDVEGPVTSPTYVLARVHRARRAGPPAMVHVDLYRLLDHGAVDLTAEKPSVRRITDDTPRSRLSTRAWRRCVRSASIPT